MQSQAVSAQTENRPGASARLYYLDWLRVIAIMGVFLFHAVHPFDFFDWHIKNAEQSMAITVVMGLLFPWGMPFFFLIAGTGSWFALRRRTAGQYVGERVKRLLIPYITGCILLWPIMLYFQWRHILWKGAWYGSFLEFVLIHRAGFSPMWFGEVGFHLWFLGFLFCFSVLGLPIFLWMKSRSGQAALARLAGFCSHRGGILLFIVPLLLVRLLLQPFFPQEHDWADFFFLMTLFVCGFVLYAHEGFARAIRRDWPILLAGAIVTSAGMGLPGPHDRESGHRSPGSHRQAGPDVECHRGQRLVLVSLHALRRHALPGFHQQVAGVCPGGRAAVLPPAPAGDHRHRLLRGAVEHGHLPEAGDRRDRLAPGHAVALRVRDPPDRLPAYGLRDEGDRQAVRSAAWRSYAGQP